MIRNQQFNTDTLLQILVSGYEYHFIFNLVCCLIAAVAIGGNREKKGKAAGISTHSLVIGAAMLYTFLSGFITDDPARIAAQIIPGVGFLGAGVILRMRGDKIGNLTTAASILFSAAVGMAIGFNWYSVAGLSVLYALITFGLPHLKGNQNEPERDQTNQEDTEGN
jgi:putative Mg2+ transporter-C (MgtC) family protein